MRFQFPRISDAKDHILAAILLVIAVALMVNKSKDGLNNVRKASITIFSYLEQPLSDLRIYRQELKGKANLRRQNVILQDKLSRLRSAQMQNKRLREMLKFRRASDLKLQPVKIIGKALDQPSYSFTINAGKKQGIEQGMPLISANGLIGKVVLVADDYSKVIPFFNTSFRVSAKLQAANAFGIVSWNGKPNKLLQMNYVPQTMSVKQDDRVLTSGYSNQFPADIPIGKVISAHPEQGKEIQKIMLKPFVNLNNIAEGFIVKFQPDTSRKNLNDHYDNIFK